MKIPLFATEQFFSRYEFSSPHLLGVSDCETISVAELLSLAGGSLSNLGRIRLGYTESQGDPELRQAVAATYNGVADGEIVILTSPIEGIYLTMRTLLEPGDRAVVLCPSYDSLRNLTEHVCGRIDPWNLIPTEDGWDLDLEQLEGLIGDKTRLVVVNFPHNPTGHLPTESQLDDLIEIVRQRGIWLFSDEMYRGTEFGNHPMLPSVGERYEKSIVLSGLSKTYGLPGLRCGWVVIRDEGIRQELINWKHYTSICPAAPSEFLSVAALKAGDALIARSKATIAKNVERADAFFRRWPDLFTWRPPKAGPVALVGIDVPSATEYCHDLARDAGMVLLPGPCLGASDHQVRFGFGRKTFAAALASYEEHLQGR